MRIKVAAKIRFTDEREQVKPIVLLLKTSTAYLRQAGQMPRGPHDDQIAEQDRETDHARKRLEQFRQGRFPTSAQPEEPNEKNDKSGKRDQPKTEKQ